MKDKEVYERMQKYIMVAEMGISREAQLRSLQLIKAILQGNENGTEIFEFAYNKMRDRWERLSWIMSKSKRFSLQEIPNRFCNFFQRVRGPSPGDHSKFI